MSENEAKAIEVIKEFIEEYEITCPECVSDDDAVITNAYELIETLCDLIGYHKAEDT